MNVPAVARKTFEELRHLAEYNSIVNFVLEHLSQLSTPSLRADFVHKAVDQYNVEVFSHPLIKELSPCKLGCSGCCHTQVSVTEDESQVLASKLEEGLKIDEARLRLQAEALNNSEAFYRLSYESRRCVFLDEKGACRVYDVRPSVCRTNAVIGSAEQCDTRESLKPTRLVRTPKADMVIYASYLHSKESGTLPHMLLRSAGAGRGNG